MADNPAPRAEGAAPGNLRVTWLDMATAVENEAGRRRIRRDEATRRRDAGGLSVVECETVQRIIAEAEHEAATFDAVSRLIERVRSNSAILSVLRAIDAKEREANDDATDEIRYE